MPDSKTNKADGASHSPPPLQRDERGHPDITSLANVIQWFLDYDPRVAVIKHPNVEELFQWKQQESQSAGEDVYIFNRAEDRLVIGIMQALAQHSTEDELHGWISQLLNTLDEVTKTNEQISEAYKLQTGQGASAVKEATKIPTQRGRADFLTCCWLEALCTAEIRVLGWVYQELYGRSYSPR